MTRSRTVSPVFRPPSVVLLCGWFLVLFVLPMILVAQPAGEAPKGSTAQGTAEDEQGSGDSIPPLMMLITAAGALGTAAFGIVEGFKSTRLGNAGFRQIEETLGPLLDALGVAYGPDYRTLVLAHYKGDAAELKRTLRQGTRIGLHEGNAVELAGFVGVPEDTERFRKVVAKIDAGTDLKDEERRLLARFEAAVKTMLRKR